MIIGARTRRKEKTLRKELNLLKKKFRILPPAQITKSAMKPFAISF